MNVEKVSRERLDQIEYLLYQSTNGIHLLFEKDSLRETLKIPVDAKKYFTFDNLNRVQDILAEMIKQPTIEDKISYLSSLEGDAYELLVRTYFNIVENTVLERNPNRH